MLKRLWSWSKLGTIGAFLGAILVVLFVVFLFWYNMWVSCVENYELGFVFDRVTGKIELLDKQGWIVRTPFRYSVHKLDLRPHQLQFSANQRVLNAKLCRFDPKGLETFVEWHGRDAGDKTDNLQEILKCYAFDLADGKDCPFLEVIQEIAPNQGGGKSPQRIHIEGEQK
jgi:hypothetical protein